MRLLAALTFLLAQPAGWKPPAVRIQDEGALKGYASTINCVGAGISCSVGASVATVTVSGGGGGGGSPGGSSGNVQINSAGSFGAYTGTTCAYAVKSLDANGAATCTAAPTIPTPAGTASELQIRASGTAFGAYTGTGACAAGSFMTSLDAFGAKTCGTPAIPADISAAHYVTTQAEAGLSAEAVLPTCTGTDKLTFNGTTISCATDQTSAGGGAPTTVPYWTGAADATLTAEKDLSALATGLVINTAGTPSAYGGATCTNQFVSALSASGAATCTTDTLAGAQHANQGTATTLLHGNAAGNPTWAAASLTADVTGTLPIANGGTNSTATPTNGGVGYGTGTAHAYTAAGTSGQVLTSNGAAAPTWATPAAGGGGYATVQDEGSALTQRATVNFAGGGVTCVDNAGSTRTDCTVPEGYEFLGSTTMASTAATSATITFSARSYIRFIVWVAGYSGSDIVSLRFGTGAGVDTGQNYSDRNVHMATGGSTFTWTECSATASTAGCGTATNRVRMRLGSNAITGARLVTVDCINLATTAKACKIDQMSSSASAATPSVFGNGSGVWANVSAQMTQVQMHANAGASLNAGSFIQVFGHN
jgi:hypothetical protein